jgi:hypothetical protein
MLAHKIISVWKIIAFSRCELAWTFWDVAVENSYEEGWWKIWSLSFGHSGQNMKLW